MPVSCRSCCTMYCNKQVGHCHYTLRVWSRMQEGKKACAGNSCRRRAPILPRGSLRLGRTPFFQHEPRTWSRSSTRTAASCGLICCMRFRMAVAALRVFSASTRRSMPDCSRSSPPAAVDFLPLAAGFGSSSAGGEAQNSRMTSCSAAGGIAQLLPAMHCCNEQAWRKPLQRISHSVLQQSDRILLSRNEKNRGLRCMSSGPPECRRWPQFARWSHPRADRQRRCALALRGPPRLLL